VTHAKTPATRIPVGRIGSLCRQRLLYLEEAIGKCADRFASGADHFRARGNGGSLESRVHVTFAVCLVIGPGGQILVSCSKVNRSPKFPFPLA
jgi:hypothetical protein